MCPRCLSTSVPTICASSSPRLLSLLFAPHCPAVSETAGPTANEEAKGPSQFFAQVLQWQPAPDCPQDAAVSAVPAAPEGLPTTEPAGDNAEQEQLVQMSDLCATVPVMPALEHRTAHQGQLSCSEVVLQQAMRATVEAFVGGFTKPADSPMALQLYVDRMFQEKADVCRAPKVRRDMILNVTVVQGAQLAPKDANGRSDPYCILELMPFLGRYKNLL